MCLCRNVRPAGEGRAGQPLPSAHRRRPSTVTGLAAASVTKAATSSSPHPVNSAAALHRPGRNPACASSRGIPGCQEAWPAGPRIREKKKRAPSSKTAPAFAPWTMAGPGNVEAMQHQHPLFQNKADPRVENGFSYQRAATCPKADGTTLLHCRCAGT